MNDVSFADGHNRSRRRPLSPADATIGLLLLFVQIHYSESFDWSHQQNNDPTPWRIADFEELIRAVERNAPDVKEIDAIGSGM